MGALTIALTNFHFIQPGCLAGTRAILRPLVLSSIRFHFISQDDEAHLRAKRFSETFSSRWWLRQRKAEEEAFKGT